MSLINDALRRAAADKPRDAQSAEVPPLQPVESASRPATSPLLVGGILLLGTGMIAVAAALWFSGRSNSNNDATAQASANRAAVAPTVSPIAEPSPVIANVPATNRPSALAVEKETSVIPQAAGPQTSTRATAASSDTKNANTPPKAVASSRPAAPTAQQTAEANQKPVRLQSIFYRLKSPTVIINGKTLGVGDSVDGIKVVSIQRTSVEIVQNGKYRTVTLQD